MTTTKPTFSQSGTMPLSGLKVVSMAEQYPGPFSTMLLSDMGADVIQIERPGSGDPSRNFAAFYETVNRGKRSVALDVRSNEQRAEAIKLIEAADVFLDGFRPGKLSSRGLGYEEMSRLNPGLIYCSISGYGQTGPYRDRPAHDLSFQGVAGALDERILGDVIGAPPRFLLGDTTAALYATIGLLSALQGRHQTGRGTYIDISLCDSVLTSMSALVATAQDKDAPALPQSEPGYDMFECADGAYLTLSIAHEDVYWASLCKDLELDSLAKLSRDERVARRTELRACLAQKIAQQNRADWESKFEATAQMWGPANAIGDLTMDPQIQARGLMQRLTRADGVEQFVMRQPIKFSSYDNADLTRAPSLGEHQGQGF